MKQLLTFIIFLFFAGGLCAQVFQSADSARNLAELERKPILLYFSGSDWCPNCLRFEKTILHDTLFQNYMKDHLVLLQADFPQRKKQPKELVRQNEELAGRYNPRGVFPAFVLFNPEQSEYKFIQFDRHLPTEFIAVLEDGIEDFSTRE